MARVDLFERCTRRERRRIASLATTIDAAPGRVLVQEGHRAAEFLVILEGAASISAGGEEIATVSSGDCFGEVGLHELATRRVSVTALTPMTLLVFSRAEFLAALDLAPSVAALVRDARVVLSDVVHAPDQTTRGFEAARFAREQTAMPSNS